MLESLSIKNFRSCDNATIRLEEPVVALVGKNGVGKTNLLHAIQLVADLCVGEPESIFSIHPRERNAPTEFELAFSIEGDRYKYRVARMGIGSRVERLEERLDKNSINLFERSAEQVKAPRADFVNEGLRVGTSSSTLAALLQLLPKDHGLSNDLRPVADYLRAVRYQPLLQGFQEHVSGPPTRSFNEVFGESSPFIEISKYETWKASERLRRSVQMRLLDLHLENNPALDELKKLLGEDGLGLIADIQVEEVKMFRRQFPKANTEETPEKAYSIAFMPATGLAGSGRTFRYSGLSAGTWRILQLLTYLIYDKYSCMLVEQPEDSIHPGLLAKVVDILRTYSGRTQLICTTHSPRVMNLIGPLGIRFVAATDGRTYVHELTGNDLSAAKEYLEDEGTLSDFLDTLEGA